MYDARRKKHVCRVPTEGYISAAVRVFFPSVAKMKCTDKEFEKARSFANRCYETFKRKREDGIDAEEENAKKRYRVAGAGRKAVAPEVRQAAFQWFIDVRGGLKGRLPRKIFRLKCLELFKRWNETNGSSTTFMCSDKWITDWMCEYRVSLKHPNKRFNLSNAERKVRIEEFLKNVLRVRHFFHARYKKDPIMINGDQMPLHRNESSGQKTLSMCDESTYVKENYMLSRERVTVYTQVSTGSKLKPEFVFKGKGVRIHLDPPQGVHTQFAPKGSYRLDTMLGTIGHLPNRNNPFTSSNFALYILDDYSVHVTDEVRKALLNRGYILVCIGGGITGDVQVNDTHYHHALKREYRDREAALMLKQLEANPNTVPSPSRDDMMKMLVESWDAVDVNATDSLKSLFMMNALDGSEDHLVSDKLFELVGQSMVVFRRQLMASPAPATVTELTKLITPPKGVRRKKAEQEEAPEDEGRELFDCEGLGLNEEELAIEVNHAEAGNGDEGADDATRIPGTSKPQSHGHFLGEPSATSTSISTTVDLVPFASSCLDDSIKGDAEFLDGMKVLLETHSTSTLFIPYYLSMKMAYMKARKSLKKRLQVDSAMVTKISRNNAKEGVANDEGDSVAIDEGDSVAIAKGDSVAITKGDSVAIPQPSTSSISSEDDSPTVPDEPTSMTVGTYCLVTNGKTSIPACIVSLDPLAVRYFEDGPKGLHCPSDYTQEVFNEDISKTIQDPETVTKGSRIYYRFSV